jgi:hypothetical protein
VIRSSWLEHRDGPPSGADFQRFIRGWTNGSRRLVGGLWLRSHRSRIQKTGRSVGGLGIRADNSQLHTAGLSVREAFFRGSTSVAPLVEPELPRVTIGRMGRPCEAWVFSRRCLISSGSERAQWDRQYREDCRRERWLPPVVRSEKYWDDWWAECSSSGCESSWLNWRRLTKRVRAMGFFGNLRLRARSWVDRGGQWIPRDELPARVCRKAGVGCR